MIDEEKEKEVKKQMLEKYIAQRDSLTRWIEALQYDLGVIEVPRETGASPNLALLTPREQGQSQVRADEFFSMSQTEAAYVYLKKVGHAVHIDKILEVLKAGGVKMRGKTPKATLYTSLVRGTKRFVLVAPGTFGLAEFYPNRKEKRD